MDFASLLQQLAGVHARECEQRMLVETNLLEANRELERIKGQVEGVERKTSVVISPICEVELEHDHSGEEDGDDSENAQQLFPELSPAVSPKLVSARQVVSGTVSLRQSLIKHFQIHDEHPELTGWHEGDVNEFALLKGWKTQLDHTSTSSSHRTSWGSNSLFRLGASRTQFQRKVIRIIEGRAFETLSGMAIVANAILIGASGSYAAKHGIHATDVPRIYTLGERLFIGLFASEVLFRGLGGVTYFFCDETSSWNILDLVVVSFDCFQFLTEVLMNIKDGELDLSLLRMLRIARITRVIRLVRMVRFFKELRMMIYSILSCGTSMLWATMLFLIINYVFGIFLMSQVTDYLADNPGSHSRENELRNFFGSVPRSIYTLYGCMSGGISWMEVSDDLIEIHWLNGAALAFFVFFTLFVVANILTGIFVDTAIQSASSDRDEIIQEQICSQQSELAVLRDVFEAADTDKSGTISYPEFKEHLRDTNVRAHFLHIGIEVYEALGLFKLLDQDHSGHIGIDEFCMGCMRLKGCAKSVDLATLMYENKKLVERISLLDIFCKEQLTYLGEFLQKVSAQLQSKGFGENPHLKKRSAKDAIGNRRLWM